MLGYKRTILNLDQKKVNIPNRNFGKNYGSNYIGPVPVLFLKESAPLTKQFCKGYSI